MDKQIHELIQTYFVDRKRFIDATYLGYEVPLFKVMRKVRNRSIKEGVLTEELNFIVPFFNKLEKLKPKKEVLDLVVLALKNRNQYLTNESDFQVLFIAFSAFLLALLKLVLFAFPIFFCLLYILVFLLVCDSILRRTKLKDEVQYNCEFINLLEQYRRDFLGG